MDPNNNQPIGTNPVPQPAVPQPAAQSVPAPAAQPSTTQPVAPPIAPQPVAPQNVAETPKKGVRKRIILIILILILIIGIGVYVLFAKSQLNNTQKTSTNTTGPIPQAPSIERKKAPSVSEPTSQDDLNIESPEADLQGLDAEVSGL